MNGEGYKKRSISVPPGSLHTNFIFPAGLISFYQGSPPTYSSYVTTTSSIIFHPYIPAPAFLSTMNVIRGVLDESFLPAVSILS